MFKRENPNAIETQKEKRLSLITFKEEEEEEEEEEDRTSSKIPNPTLLS